MEHAAVNAAQKQKKQNLLSRIKQSWAVPSQLLWTSYLPWRWFSSINTAENEPMHPPSTSQFHHTVVLYVGSTAVANSTRFRVSCLSSCNHFTKV
jgi:hypothetical protein